MYFINVIYTHTCVCVCVCIVYIIVYKQLARCTITKLCLHWWEEDLRSSNKPVE